MPSSVEDSCLSPRKMGNSNPCVKIILFIWGGNDKGPMLLHSLHLSHKTLRPTLITICPHYFYTHDLTWCIQLCMDVCMYVCIYAYIYLLCLFFSNESATYSLIIKLFQTLNIFYTKGNQRNFLVLWLQDF